MFHKSIAFQAGGNSHAMSVAVAVRSVLTKNEDFSIPSVPIIFLHLSTNSSACKIFRFGAAIRHYKIGDCNRRFNSRWQDASKKSPRHQAANPDPYTTRWLWRSKATTSRLWYGSGRMPSTAILHPADARASANAKPRPRAAPEITAD